MQNLTGLLHTEEELLSKLTPHTDQDLANRLRREDRHVGDGCFGEVDMCVWTTASGAKLDVVCNHITSDEECPIPVWACLQAMREDESLARIQTLQAAAVDSITKHHQGFGAMPNSFAAAAAKGRERGELPINLAQKIAPEIYGVSFTEGNPHSAYLVMGLVQYGTLDTAK